MARPIAPRARRTGFTLTEMLIVLAILVMLVGLVVPRLLSSQQRADRQAAKAQIEILRGCLERYALDTRRFPSTEEGLQALVRAPSDTEQGVTGWDGPYINRDEIPLDPWGNEYQYVYPPERGQGDFPDIWSLGPDGEDNTEDDIASWGTSAENGDGMGPDEPLDIKVDVDVSGMR